MSARSNPNKAKLRADFLLRYPAPWEDGSARGDDFFRLPLGPGINLYVYIDGPRDFNANVVSDQPRYDDEGLHNTSERPDFAERAGHAIAAALCRGLPIDLATLPPWVDGAGLHALAERIEGMKSLSADWTRAADARQANLDHQRPTVPTQPNPRR